MLVRYYGHYCSAAIDLKGCVKEFVSTSKDDLAFPSQVSYDCDLCKTEHAFKLKNTYMIVNSSTQKRFDEFCISHYIETEVEL